MHSGGFLVPMSLEMSLPISRNSRRHFGKPGIAAPNASVTFTSLPTGVNGEHFYFSPKLHVACLYTGSLCFAQVVSLGIIVAFP